MSNPIISGTGMATLAGVVCIVGPWFTTIEFISKLGVTAVGLIVLFAGLYFSRG